MRRPALNWCLMVVAAGALAACSSSKEVPDDPNIFPSQYKQEIADTLSRTLIDPTNIRDAFVSDPVLTPLGKDQRYSACVRYKARDASRQYTGSTDRIAYFFGGHLNQLVEATKEQCGNAAYKPYPELQALCQSEHKCV
jgi:hypothetical protein